MDIPSDNNSNAGTLTGAPPPPQEVKVRTMQSDLASMAQNGGGLPKFQNVAIAGISVASRDGQETVKKTSLVAAVISILVILILLVVGYFVYQAVRNNANPPSATGVVTPGQ